MTAQAQENNTSTLLPVAYMAPESIRKQEYSIKSDSFSFGVFLWEIVTRYETETPHTKNNNAWVWSADQACY